MISYYSTKTIWVVFLILFINFQPIYGENCDQFIYNLNAPITLEKGWKFRKGDNIDWKDTYVEESLWIERSIPDYGISKTETISGYHWYRCKFLLPENFSPPQEPLAIQLGKLRDYDETYFNGHLIGKTGVLTPNMDLDFHKIRIYSIPTELLKAGENIISIRLYASTSQQGIKSIPIIDKEEKLLSKLYLKNLMPISFGHIFIIMGIYFILGTFVRGMRVENSFFGLFSVSIGLYTLIRSQYRYELFESFSNSYIFELMVLVLLPIFFINFLIAHLNEKRNYLVYINEIYLGILFFTIPFLKSINGWNLIIKLFNYSLPLTFGIVVYYTGKNFKENLPKLKYILIGLIGLIPTVVLDSLSALEIISLDGTIYFGFFFFLLMISLQLSEEMLANLQKYIALESDLIRMEKIKTGFLLNISNEFKSSIEKINQLVANLKQITLNQDTNLNKKAAKKSTKKTKKSKSQDKINVDEYKKLDSIISTTISMIDEAIILKKLENKEYNPEKINFNAKEIILEIVETIELKTNQHRKNLEISFYPDDPIIHTDKTLFYAIARNLIENAFIYTDKSVPIKIDLQIFNNYYSFSVTDEGIGMSIFEQENLFKKFVRGQNVNNIPGAGIGLTLCKQAVETLGGEIQFKSSEGLGTSFTIKIPVGKNAKKN